MKEIHQEIDKARGDLDVALGDLEIAARRLATTEHWKNAAASFVRKRPVTVVSAAFVLGLFLGRPRRRRHD